MKKLALFILAAFAFVPKVASAHCPLCTAGAGALAVLAASLGVSTVIVGILIGAFALALGYWMAPLVKRKVIPYQDEVLIALITLGTIIPIMPLVVDYGPLYVALWGEYGTFLHTTYTINLFILGSIIGVLLMYAAPIVSGFVSKKRGMTMPYQGIIITFILLVVASLIAQFWPWSV